MIFLVERTVEFVGLIAGVLSWEEDIDFYSAVSSVWHFTNKHETMLLPIAKTFVIMHHL